MSTLMNRVAGVSRMMRTVADPGPLAADRLPARRPGPATDPGPHPVASR